MALGLIWAFALPALAAEADREQERCLELVKFVTEDMRADMSLLAQLRDELQEAADLCREGRIEEAEALLKKLQRDWMPMGSGN